MRFQFTNADHYLQLDVPFANPASLSTVFVQGSSPLGSQQDSGLTSTVKPNIQDAINFELAKNRKYLESPFSVGMLPDGSYALWINRQVAHTLPVAIAWLANNDARQPFAFTVSSAPLQDPPRDSPVSPASKEPLSIPNFLLHIYMTFLVAVTLSTVPCLSIRAVVADRTVQTKHLLSGTFTPKYVQETVFLVQFCEQLWASLHPCTGLQTGYSTLQQC